MEPPYPGQGKPIPPELGEGDWVVENRIFLTTNDLPNSPIQMSHAGNDCFRFQASRIARVMGISVPDIIQANRDGKLGVTNKTIDPRPGTSGAMRFRFVLGVRSFVFTVGWGRPLAQFSHTKLRDRRSSLAITSLAFCFLQVARAFSSSWLIVALPLSISVYSATKPTHRPPFR